MKVRKAVVVAAGWGTRFLPLTKCQPKEMLPLMNKPLIQYAVEEAASCGIKQIVVITAPGVQAFADYFTPAPELESFLEQKAEDGLLEEVRKLTGLADICCVTQERRLGLGHAILMAKSVVGKEPFAVLLRDDVVDSQVLVLKQMLEVFNEYRTNILAVDRISSQDSKKYGVIKPRSVSTGIYQVLGMIEKPEPEAAPSNLGIVGRYILMPEVFDALEATPPGRDREIQLTDALQLLLKKQTIYALEFDGVRYDTGTPQGWLEAQVAFALKNPELGPGLRRHLNRLLN